MLAPAQKNFSTLAGEDDDVDFVVEARLEDALVEIAHHLVGIGVGRRIGQREIGDVVADLVVD